MSRFDITRRACIVRRLSGDGPSPAAVPPGHSEILPLSEVERRALEHALTALGGNVSNVAKALGISRATVYAKMKKYGLDGGGS